jgi:hypothetical protein
LATIEPGTLCVIQSSQPGIAARVVLSPSPHLQVSTPCALLPAPCVLTVAGVRRGFSHWHYQPFTDAQRLRNSAFYAAAYA